jgi:single-stranded DNA-binding protein
LIYHSKRNPVAKGTHMIDALIGGKIYGKPSEHVSKAGKPYARAKVRVATGAEESIFVSCIAFDAEPVNALLALGDGDSVAMSGTLKPGVWTDRQGIAKPSLDLTVHQVLTSYHVQRKRQAVAKAVPDSGRSSKSGSSSHSDMDEFDGSSDMPF